MQSAQIKALRLLQHAKVVVYDDLGAQVRDEECLPAAVT